MTDSPGVRMRRLVEQPEILSLPGAFDPLSARLAERAGFDAVFTSGFSIAATKLGLPDVGLMTASENLDRVRRTAGAIDAPLVADMDTGYGNALNVRRTIDECLDAGVAGVILEDQQWPKRCGHMDEKRVVPREEHVQRIRAAADVREERGQDLIIIGRTDAREPYDLGTAIERGRAYHEAGADVVFVEAPESRDELRRITDEIDAPTFANMIEGGKTPFCTADELDAMGFDIVVFPLTALFSLTKAVEDAYETLASEGTTEGVDTHDFAEFEAILGTETYREQQREYAVEE
jgi:methylisocitrate lyase